MATLQELQESILAVINVHIAEESKKAIAAYLIANPITGAKGPTGSTGFTGSVGPTGFTGSKGNILLGFVKVKFIVADLQSFVPAEKDHLRVK